MRSDALQPFKKHHQPQQREFGRHSDCVPYEIRKTPVNGLNETQISTTGLQLSEPEVN